MRVGGRFLLAATLFISAAAVFASAGAVEVAKAKSPSGTSSITHDGQTTNVGPTTQFQDGDIVRVPTDGRLTIEYADGSTLALVGPAGLRFGQMNAMGRRVVLGSGVITEATVRGIALEIQAPDPTDASLVLQNARGFARVNLGDRVVFQKIEGVFGKVWRGGKYTDLGTNAWTLNTRDGSITTGPADAQGKGGRGPSHRGPSPEETVAPDTVRVYLGGHEIVFHPASGFSRELTDGYGLLLTFNGTAANKGGGDEWGVVEIGRETTLFVAQGQSVRFDGNGQVTRFDGISHVYHPLFDPFFRDQPIENAIDASPSLSKNR